jgi:two-component system, OmpR family, sensor kinase
MKLRVALAVRLVLVIAAALIVLGLFVVRQTRADLLAQVDDRMRGALIRRPKDTAPPTQTAVPAIDDEPRASARLIVIPSGAIVTFGPSGTQAKPDPRPVLDRKWVTRELRHRAGPGRGKTVRSSSVNFRYRVMAVVLADGNLGVEATPLTVVDKSVRELIRTLIVGSLLVLAGAALTAYAVLRRSLRPLATMANAASRIASGNVSLDPGAASPHPELHDLGVALNTMVGRLRASTAERTAALEQKNAIERKLRRFVSDASHELQTPITSIRGWAELYRQGGLTDPGALSNAMARVETESARMGRLVDDLLTLARSDEQREPRRRPVDVGPICADAVTDAGAVDPSRIVTLSDSRGVDSSGQQSMVAGDPDSLRQVIDNLLSNARRYTPTGTPIEVNLRGAEDSVSIVISDNGPGFPVKDLAHIFDRFWRMEHHRDDPATAVRGSGLGLAIVHAIVDAHGGEVTAENRPSGGATVIVRLPIVTPSSLP